jgi:hypothetical protein
VAVAVETSQELRERVALVAVEMAALCIQIPARREPPILAAEAVALAAILLEAPAAPAS